MKYNFGKGDFKNFIKLLNLLKKLNDIISKKIWNP